jgi:hypothetical protein
MLEGDIQGQVRGAENVLHDRWTVRYISYDIDYNMLQRGDLCLPRET